MDSDDDNDERDIDEYLHLHAGNDLTSEPARLLVQLQRIMPRQTIIYIQYCLLRVPFLLLYDYLFTEQFTSLFDRFLGYSSEVLDKEKNVLLAPISYILHSYFFRLLIDINLIFSIPILGLIFLIVLLLCSDRRLVIFYSYTTSILIIYFFYQINRLAEIQLHIFGMLIVLSSIYVQMLRLRSDVYTHPMETRLCYFAPFLHLFTRLLLPLKYSVLIQNSYYLVWLIAHSLELVICQWDMFILFVRASFLNDIVSLYNNLGVHALINYLQERIDTITLMKIFWLTKIIVVPLGFRAIYTHPFLVNGTAAINTTNETILNYETSLTKTVYFTAIFYGTETTFTLISFACLVSHGVKLVSHRLFRLLHLWNEDVEQIGVVMGVMLFLLLFQSNLTQLDLDRRHIPLLKAFSLLVVALFHFLHTILEPQLLKVAMQTMTTQMAFEQTDVSSEAFVNTEETSPSKVSTWKILRSYRHRHVYTCLSILLFLILYISFLWRMTAFSTWLLAITAFSLELIVRLLASLAQYTLHVLDAHNRLSNVESFDEYIFRVKAVTSCFEFVLGLFLFGNGLYILFFEARGALRAFMLTVHAYLNIIKNFRRGWQILCNRKSAWNHVRQLPLATQEQINDYNDICSICHNALTPSNTCITPCLHLFHQKCLQKVFYASQNCALCSRPIVSPRRDRQQ